MARLVRVNTKATVTPLIITEVYRRAFVNAQHVKPWSRWIKAAEEYTECYSCQLRMGNRLQFLRTHQTWTLEDWKNVAWSDESRFLLRHSDGRVIIWCKHHKQ